MDSLNVVVLTGTLDRNPTIRFDENSASPRCSATLRCAELGTSGSTFKLYVPLEAWGKTAEALGELHAGQLVAIQGKLCWRKGKEGEKGGLAVLVGKVSVIVPETVPA